MDLKDWTGAVTAGVALYAGALSTYNLLVARRERRREVRVTLKWGVLGVEPEPMTALFLTAANPGHRSVTLAGCHLTLPNRKTFVMPWAQSTVKFPHDLQEGKNCTVWFPVGEVGRALVAEGFRGEVSVTAVFTDALDNAYTSRPFRGNVEEWAKGG